MPGGTPLQHMGRWGCPTVHALGKEPEKEKEKEKEPPEDHPVVGGGAPSASTACESKDL